MSSKVFYKQQPTQKDQDFDTPQESYKILCGLLSQILQSDPHEILGRISEKEYRYQNNMEKLNIDHKKLFHIDLRQKQVYWEINKGETRNIIRQCLHTKEFRQKWAFQDKQLGPRRVIEVLGKHKYNQLQARSIKNECTLTIINLNVFNDAYTEFDDFLSDLVDLINQNLIIVFDGRFLKPTNPRDKQNHQKIHQDMWQWYSYQMTKFWSTLWSHLKSSKIPQKYNMALYKEIQKLFEQNTKYRCKQGLKRRPPTNQNRTDYSYMEKAYGNESLKKSFDLSMSIDCRPVNYLLGLNYSELEEISYSDQTRYPYPENYPLTDTIEYERNADIDNIGYMRKSMKRPANNCHENCICLKNDGVQCPNLQIKIQCQNHSCMNSQIRDNKGVLCWYKDEQKNEPNYENPFLYEKLKQGYYLQQFYSFGIDLYTSNILLKLMPLERIEDDTNVSNEGHKKRIIENIIPYELSKTQNLFQAIVNISTKRQYQDYRYEAKILEKKLIWIRRLQNQNNLAKIRGLEQYFPNVTTLEGYYMGLGVLNIGQTIPKGKFIGKFVGELLCPWRQEEKQIISTKHNEKIENQGNQIKFYCITVQSHFDQTIEPKCFTVDPQNVGNFCRSLNHSCNPNCRVEVMVSEGKYVLGVYAIKQIKENDQLTFDYDSVTDNLEEYKHSACLCGSLGCRGRYLRFQDEIYLGLDLGFLENKFPMKARIKKLMRNCFLSDPQLKQDEYLKSIKILHERQVFYQCIPKKLDHWIFIWIRALNHTIQKETQYLEVKSRRQHQNLENMTPEYSQRLLKIIEKQKLCILNSKVEKIAHLFIKLNDFSPPFESKPPQNVLEYLEKILGQIQDFSFGQQSSKFIKRQQKRQQTLKRIKKIRFGLLEVAQSFHRKVNLDKSHYYLKKTFQFSLVKVHTYPDYESKPIEIWMQNAGKIKESVKFYGSNLYMLENLISWPGEFKRLYKWQTRGQKENKKTQVQEDEGYDGQMIKFKRQYLKKLIIEIASELEQQRYKLQKMDFIKDKRLMTKNINFKKLKDDLGYWIEKEVNIIRNQGPKLSRNIEQRSDLKYSISQSKDSSRASNKDKNVDKKITETSKIHQKLLQSKTLKVETKENMFTIPSKQKQSDKKIAKKGGKRQLKQFDFQQHPIQRIQEQLQSKDRYKTVQINLSNGLAQEIFVQEQKPNQQKQTLLKEPITQKIQTPKKSTSRSKAKQKKQAPIEQPKPKKETPKKEPKIEEPKKSPQKETPKKLSPKKSPKKETPKKQHMKQAPKKETFTKQKPQRQSIIVKEKPKKQLKQKKETPIKSPKAKKQKTPYKPKIQSKIQKLSKPQKQVNCKSEQKSKSLSKPKEKTPPIKTRISKIMQQK